MMTEENHSGQKLPIEVDPSAYHYYLPEELIAKRPMVPRDHSRLMVYNRKRDEVIHAKFFELPKFLDSGTRLIFNQSKVFPCRLFAKKETGGKAEIFVLSLDQTDKGYTCLVKSGSKKKIGQKLLIGEENEANATIQKANDDGSFDLEFSLDINEVVTRFGKTPIPPYIRGGESDERDVSDYQTVYAKEAGSVAAPTAGLHFTDDVFKNLKAKEIERSFVTLHVGLGTFAPLKYDQLKNKKLHKELFHIAKDDWDNIQNSKKKIAVGTTSLRALESVDDVDKWSSTEIFIFPGYDVKSVDGIITNFHLPSSSLLMLVSALIGREKTLELYELAVKEKYRFFSYGDAMLIL